MRSPRSELSVRCAQWARDQGVDPIGSVGCYDAFLMIEVPLPWAADIGTTPGLAELKPLLDASNCRLQAVALASNSPSRRLVLFKRTGGHFSTYGRYETVVRAENVTLAATQLLTADEPQSDPACNSSAVDVLVCTHGRRDACCGSLGTRLSKELEDIHLDIPVDVHIHRTSHTGGHRFAPTMLVFPEGSGWAYLDRKTVLKIIDRRDSPTEELLAHYRGCAGLSSPRVQAVERSLLTEFGWKLLELPRWATETTEGTVYFNVEFPDRIASWEASVRETRVLMTPRCGHPLEASEKTSPEYAVSHLRQLS